MDEPTLASLNIRVYCNTYFYKVVHSIPRYYVQIQYYYKVTVTSRTFKSNPKFKSHRFHKIKL